MKVPARFLLCAYLVAALTGATTGFLIGLVGTFPSGFAIFVATGGLVVGSFIGLVALTGVFIALGLSAKLQHHNGMRRLIVSVTAAAVAAAAIHFIYIEMKLLDPLLFVVITFVVSGVVAFVAYPFARSAMVEELAKAAV